MLSIGLAPNKFLAKLGSNLEKPRSFVIIGSENSSLSLENLPMCVVGVKTATVLEAMGINTIGKLHGVDPAKLAARFGETGYQLHRCRKTVHNN